MAYPGTLALALTLVSEDLASSVQGHTAEQGCVLLHTAEQGDGLLHPDRQGGLAYGIHLDQADRFS